MSTAFGSYFAHACKVFDVYTNQKRFFVFELFIIMTYQYIAR